MPIKSTPVPLSTHNVFVSAQSEQQKKTHAKDRALANFDDFYGSVFGKRWSSIRAALLTRHKYMALVNNFGDTEQTIAELEAAGKY